MPKKQCKNCEWWDGNYYWGQWHVVDEEVEVPKTFLGWQFGTKKVRRTMERMYNRSNDPTDPRDSVQGKCKRNAPVAHPEGRYTLEGGYPITYPEHCCGDWEEEKDATRHLRS